MEFWHEFQKFDFGALGTKVVVPQFMLRVFSKSKPFSISIAFFATNKARARHTTVIKKIRIDKTYADRSDEDKVKNYHAQVDYIMQQYMQKETQNKIKCLYTNLVRKIK